MPTLTLERLQSPEEIEADLREALAIVEHLEPPEDLRVETFKLAAQLVCRRAVPSGAGAAVPAGALAALQADLRPGGH